jgi:carbonic anhydrase/acetyltransferase-like protein (isoleucine patch superfamily)
MAEALIIGVGGLEPEVDPSAFVAPTAVVVGAVRLGPRASIWYQAVLRGDAETISIGADTNIQDNCTVHADPGCRVEVGERVTVGHNAVLHGCVVEDDVLVGMGARVLNGARIGAGSLIAAGAVVQQGTQVPPGSMVAGVPARVKRQVTADELVSIKANAEGYLLLMQAHAAIPGQRG